MLHFGDVAVLPLVVHVYCVSADLYVAMYPAAISMNHSILYTWLLMAASQTEAVWPAGYYYTRCTHSVINSRSSV